MKTCIICGQGINGHGHNPEPIRSFESGRCCDSCNYTKVIPQRLFEITKYQEV